MNASIGYIFAIIFIILAINIYFLSIRNRTGKRYKRITRAASDEAKQALWRDNEIARRIAREQEDAIERVTLRNETLALYDEVRRRAAARESEGTLMTGRQWKEMENDFERFR